MKKFAMSALFLSLSSAFAQTIPALDSNSEYFSIKDYYYYENGRPDLSVYNVSGFFQKSSAGHVQQIFLLPRISFNQLKFLDNNGKSYSESEDFNPDNIKKVQISLNYNGNTPTKAQSISILKSVTHNSTDTMPDSIQVLNVNANDNIVVASLPPNQKNQLIDVINQYQTNITNNNNLANTWNNYSPNTVAMNDLSINILVDGEVVGSTKIKNTVVSNGVLPNIYINNMTPYIVNRLKEKDYQLSLTYNFKDSKLSSIHGSVSNERLISKIVSESRKTTTSTSSSGFQFLGFGSRKQSMRESVKEQFDEQFSNKSFANTTVTMEDPDDNLTTYFESIFFPKITEHEVITNHLAAAEKAAAEGKKDLEKAHRKYADYLSKQNPDLTVDTGAAIASLSEGDYVGFIAQGFKAGSVKGYSSSDYVRVLNFNSYEIKQQNVDLNKNVSVNRSVTQFIERENRDRKNFSGICGFATIPFVEHTILAYPTNGDPVFHDTLVFGVVTCVINGSPANLANISPGALIYKINGQKFRTQDDFIRLMNSSSTAALTMGVPYVNPTRFGSFINFRYYTTNVQLGKGIYQ